MESRVCYLLRPELGESCIIKGDANNIPAASIMQPAAGVAAAAAAAVPEGSFAGPSRHKL